MAYLFDDASERRVYRSEKLVTHIVCDCCEKHIPTDFAVPREDRGYFHVTTGHNDWGNDSCDSVEWRDLCPECAEKVFADYISKARGSEYIELTHKTACPFYELVEDHRVVED